MNKFDTNLAKLQECLKEKGLKSYIIFVQDYHLSEYTHEYFSLERKNVCSFLGSDGYVLVTQDKAYLYTDGRYWMEAEIELKGTNVELVRMGAAGVPSVYDFVKSNDLFPLGFDFRLMSAMQYEKIKDWDIKDVSFFNLVENPTPLPFNKIWKLSDKLLSTTLEERVNTVMDKANSLGAESFLLTTLDDVAYLLGARSSDVPCNPVFYSYLYIDKDRHITLFTDAKEICELNNVEVKPYSEIDNFLIERKDVPTLVDPSRVNAHLYNILTHKVCAENPTVLMKAVKGPVEIKNIKRVHQQDGLAMLKFYKFIKEHSKENLSEMDYSDELKKFRFENKDIFDLSFPTIAGFGQNGAMMHYEPTYENCAICDPKENTFLLVDSGGQYYGGTTDITRTYFFGKPSKEMVRDYTLTLKSVIDLSMTVFMEGSTGTTIDIKARENMWRLGMDYKCGTGHGVGYILNVHEGPNRFYYTRQNSVMLPGMITTIEPGVYKDYRYGIRIENELLTVPAFKTKDGTFYKFEPVTYAPIAVEHLDLMLLSDEEIKYLNDYHKLVNKKLTPLIKDKKLKAFLDKVTKPVVRK